MTLSMDVKVTADTKGLKEIRRRLIAATAQHVQVGFFGGQPHPNAPEHTVAEIAAIQEFGLPSQNIPERPFIAATVRSTNVGNTLAKSMKRFLNRTEIVQGVWTAAGIKLVRDMQLVITEFSSPANAPFTVAKKGFDNPLIETGHMRDSVDFKVGRKR